MDKTKKKSFPLLSSEQTNINKKGKPSGKKVQLYISKKGIAIGSGMERIQVNKSHLQVLEGLLKSKHHFVLQASEGDGIKVVGSDGLSRCIVLFRSGNLQTFNLKADRDCVLNLLTQLNIPKDQVNIRNNSKSKYVYTDFNKEITPEQLIQFITMLPPSTSCICGHHKDKAEKKSQAA